MEATRALDVLFKDVPVPQRYVLPSELAAPQAVVGSEVERRFPID